MLKPFAQAFAYGADNFASTPTTTSNSVGTAVTGGNSANGSAVAWGGGALGFEGQLLHVVWFRGSTANADTRSLFDILIDPAGGTSWASTPLVSDIVAGFAGASTGNGARELWLPIRIPSGANLGLQARSLTTGRTHNVLMQVFGGYKGPGAWRSGSRVVTIGIDAANYNGTLVTPGASGSWGSWTSVPASTTTATNYWCFNLLCGGINSGTASGHAIYAQIGAGSQTLGGSHVHLSSYITTAETLGWHNMTPIWADVPEGTQMQVRAKNSTTSPQDNGFAIYAVTG